MAIKGKNTNTYKGGKFNKVQWSAKVVNDETKEVPTLDFSKNFYQRAYDLKTVKTKINKELNVVTKQIKKIKNDKDTGDLLKNGLTNQLSAYENARTTFLKDVKALYNGAINTYNEWLQYIYEQLARTAITNQGSATAVNPGDISGDDNAGTE